MKARIAQIAPGLPEGVSIEPFYDRSDLIARAIDTLKHTLWEAVILVTLVHILFLFHFRSILTVTLPLPASILIAFILMKEFGITSHIMSLTGIAISIQQPGVAGFIYSRSGLGAKHGLTVAQGVGVIDPDYRGEIIVWLLNTAQEPRTVSRHERIAQLVLAPIVRPIVTPVDDLDDTSRGDGGFGHTGKV